MLLVKDLYHIDLNSVIHNDIYYLIIPVEYLMDIDNYNQFVFVDDINVDNVQVLKNNWMQVLYQYKDDCIFQLYVNDIDKF